MAVFPCRLSGRLLAKADVAIAAAAREQKLAAA
jgi:hypothetical protein